MKMKSDDLPTRILGIFAHEDDEVIGVGGLLARNSSEGGESKIICFGGFNTHREKELSAACDILGLSYEALGLPETEYLPSNDEIKNSLVQHIIDFKPQFIVTHNPVDYHHHHTIVSNYAKSAAMFACNKPNGIRVDGLLFTETNFMLPEYHVAVDITDYMDKKLEAMACHESQLKKGENYYAKLIQQKAALRGLQSGVEYAEAFRFEKLPIVGMFNDRKLAL